jgi:hypothetical protein
MVMAGGPHQCVRLIGVCPRPYVGPQPPWGQAAEHKCRKRFFFKKKKQEISIYWGLWQQPGTEHQEQTFLRFF